MAERQSKELSTKEDKKCFDEFSQRQTCSICWALPEGWPKDGILKADV